MPKLTDLPTDLKKFLQSRPDLKSICNYSILDTKGHVVQHFVKIDDCWYDDTDEYKEKTHDK